MAGHIAHPREMWMLRGLGGETWKGEPFVRPRRKWEDNSEVDREEVGWLGMDWTDQSQDMDKWRTVLNAVINIGIP